MTESRVWTLKQLANRIDAQLDGNEECSINGLNTLQLAQPGELSFLANPTYRRYLGNTQASAVILKADAAAGYDGNKLIVDNPYLSYARLTAFFDPAPRVAVGVHPSAVIDPSAELGDDVCIGANVTVGAGAVIASGAQIGAGSQIGEHCQIGENTCLQANVTLYHGVSVGHRVTLHSGCVIGADGFGFAPSATGWVKVHQIGGVVIGDDVEIGACTTIDRGALDDTVIGRGTIIDNQVQIAHNVRIGENTAIAGCTGIAGSTQIGRNCTIAGAVSIVGHLTIADDVHISVNTLVNKSISQAGSYSSGTVALPTKVWRRNTVRFGQLDQIAQRLSRLEKQASSADKDK